ncbi:hypothetical protein D8Y20_13030 [Mariprofundus sp. EBB-1]|uniref:hypothetical protein n=1 Tax=Mariprofundus sp. EBB-1 TaxID=2650971 RepID=UPI000EF213A7|nr:hypothetical protein [Mariprofundus sp. EBB-1]RLL49442.1 hypothetical protein D8Y20_13030 [Mariprofundus sp. EBB-1]
MDSSEMKKTEVKETEVQSGNKADLGVWKRMMRNYALAMIAGIALLSYLVPNMPDDASDFMLGTLIVGGLLVFAGAFGVVVAVFFYYLNKSKL